MTTTRFREKPPRSTVLGQGITELPLTVVCPRFLEETITEFLAVAEIAYVAILSQVYTNAWKGSTLFCRLSGPLRRKTSCSRLMTRDFIREMD